MDHRRPSKLHPEERGLIRRPSKLHPEERTLIEGLMYRVMECGEIPARILQYGSGEVEEDMKAGIDKNSPSALMTAMESGLIPIGS